MPAAAIALAVTSPAGRVIVTTPPPTLASTTVPVEGDGWLDLGVDEAFSPPPGGESTQDANGRTTQAGFNGSYVRDVATTSLGLVAVGAMVIDGERVNAVWVSPDGSGWSLAHRFEESSIDVSATVERDGRVLIGATATSGGRRAAVTLSTTDLATWSETPIATDDVVQLLAIADGPDGLVAITLERHGDELGSAIFHSADTTTWAPVYWTTDHLVDVAATDDAYYAVGARATNAMVMTSTDGVSWSVEDADIGVGSLFDVEATADRVVAAGSTDTDVVSMFVWTPEHGRVELAADRPTAGPGNGALVVTDDGFVVLSNELERQRVNVATIEYRSNDGATWTRTATGIDSEPRVAAVLVGEQIVTLGPGGVVPPNVDATAEIEPWDAISVWTRDVG